MGTEDPQRILVDARDLAEAVRSVAAGHPPGWFHRSPELAATALVSAIRTARTASQDEEPATAPAKQDPFVFVPESVEFA